MAVFAAMLFLVGTVAADGGPHGGFTATTQKCQACHSPHRAQSRDILRGGSGTYYSFCTTCHGPGGDAHTNVVDGAWMTGSAVFADSSTFGTAGKQLNGGKFSGVSTHSVASEATGLTKWGGDNVTGADVNYGSTAFTCVRCHGPHGRNLPDGGAQENGGTDQYRLLRNADNVLSWESTTNLGAGLTKSYTEVAWKSGMEGFCAYCHADYNTMTAPDNSAVPNKPSGSGYAHAIGITLTSSMVTRLTDSGYKLPVARDDAFGTAYSVIQATPVISGAASLSLGSYSTSDRVTCTTCHSPHGSDATETDASWTAEFNAAGDASLLRFGNRTVCQTCHAKGTPWPAP